jgi:hypothetical protein
VAVLLEVDVVVEDTEVDEDAEVSVAEVIAAIGDDVGVATGVEV